MNKKTVNINIGPQDEASWFFVSVAAVAIVFIIWGVPVVTNGDIERAKIQSKAK